MFDVPFVYSAPVPSCTTSHYFRESKTKSFYDDISFQEGCEVYFVKSQGMPIVLDAGASSSISPLREDFIGYLEMAKFSTVRGLKGENKVVG
jgi:hypothetical protein